MALLIQVPTRQVQYNRVKSDPKPVAIEVRKAAKRVNAAMLRARLDELNPAKATLRRLEELEGPC
jgi:hypothetical protein